MVSTLHHIKFQQNHVPYFLTLYHHLNKKKDSRNHSYLILYLIVLLVIFFKNFILPYLPSQATHKQSKLEHSLFSFSENILHPNILFKLDILHSISDI